MVDEHRIALWVQYDGAEFNGWQLQKGTSSRSVQSALEQALSFVADEAIRVHCAGRTDTGVHATAQMVHFETTRHRPMQGWIRGANANLQTAVSVYSGCTVDASFHARFSALSRSYRYLIYNAGTRPALGADYLCWVRQPLDAVKMHAQAQALLGELDFSSFRAASCQSSTPMRRVDAIEVSRRGPVIVIDITANAFLHHMVRNIAGALIAVGRGDRAEGWLAELLAARDRTLAPDTAMAGGLYLVGVQYPQQYDLPPPEPGPWFAPLPA
ncbi:MAG: tRNA pseudouridine(38-40) synthase TruA [Pseudomonadota bacterium]